MRKHTEAARQQAFTLVELLVVIGIIAVLIAILLHTLSKARDSASRVVCMSNIRQSGLAFVMYANDNRGQIPFGYYSTQMWTGYTVYHRNLPTDRGKLLIWGVLKAARLLSSPQFAYCPKQTDERVKYNSESNPWTFPPVSPNNLIRVGFMTRPAVSWPLTMPLREGDVVLPAAGMPKIHKLKQKAILSDVVGIPTAATGLGTLFLPHTTGINVMYADYSVQFIGHDRVDARLKQILASSFPPPGNLYLDETTDPAKPTGLWADLDKSK